MEPGKEKWAELLREKTTPSRPRAFRNAFFRKLRREQERTNPTGWRIPAWAGAAAVLSAVAMILFFSPDSWWDRAGDRSVPRELVENIEMLDGESDVDFASLNDEEWTILLEKDRG